MITLAIFILLAAAVFGLMSGVIGSTGTLQDNQNQRDQMASLTAFMKKKIGAMPVASTLVSYQRGNGDGLVQNGIIFGTVNYATAFDAEVQPNGYYTLRLTSVSTSTATEQQQDARQVLQQSVTTDDPTLNWTPLVKYIKTLDWKFLDFNVTQWVELWSSSAKPNLMEFTLQPATDSQPTTIDFWLPKLDTINLNIPRATARQ